MISFKSFIFAIQDAIVGMNNVLMEKNVSILDEYFTEGPKTASRAEPDPSKTTLVPRTVILEYPRLLADGTVENKEVSVPLITLVPLSMSQMSKATLSAGFEMEIVDGELQLHFAKESGSGGLFSKKPKTAWGKIDITFSPQEQTDGFKLLVEGYEAILKRQIS